MKKWKLGIIAAVVIVAVVIIVISVMGANRSWIVEQYYSISNRPENSARQFKIPFGYITVNSDGTVNIEFATSASTISSDINVGDDSSDTASGDDDRQNSNGTGSGNNGSGSGNGNGNGSNPPAGGQVAQGPSPINGDTLTFPNMGEELWYRNINTREEGYRKRVGPDVVAWEFALGYIMSTNKFPEMTRRANCIAPYVTNPNTHDALKVNLGGQECYVGGLPIAGFGTLGDIVEFTFDNGNTIRVLGIDAKKTDDPQGTGATGQCNTQYCHGVISGDDIKLCAVELWCAGDKTANGNRSTFPKGNVVQAKIVGHWDGF